MMLTISILPLPFFVLAIKYFKANLKKKKRIRERVILYLRPCIEFRFLFKGWGRARMSCILNACFDFEERPHPDAILPIVSLFLHTSMMQISTGLQASGIKRIRSDPEEIRLQARKIFFNKIEAFPAWNFQTPSGRLRSHDLRCNSIK